MTNCISFQPYYSLKNGLIRIGNLGRIAVKWIIRKIGLDNRIAQVANLLFWRININASNSRSRQPDSERSESSAPHETYEQEVATFETKLRNWISRNSKNTATIQVSDILLNLIRNRNIKECDLVGFKLQSLPTCMNKLTQLTGMDLSGNHFSEFPTILIHLEQLERLNLSNNLLTCLSPGVAKLTKLKTLDLSRNHLTTFPPEILSLGELKTLIIRNNRIEVLPDGIGQLTSLKKLNVSANKISVLPKTIGILPLVKLYLYSNPLQSFPIDITKITSLKKLYLSDCLISEVPNEITQLTALLELDLSGNAFMEITDCIFDLTSLEDLDLSRTRLSALSSRIGNLRGLVRLVLDNNPLYALPPEIGNLTYLQTFTCANCNLRSLPREIVNLITLDLLDIGGNLFEELPVGLGELQNLTSISVDRNGFLRNLPMSLGQLPNLLELDASYSPVALQAEIIMEVTMALRGRSGVDTLNSQLNLWISYSALENCNLTFILGLERRKQLIIYEWLLRLTKTREFRGNQQQLAEKACQMLLTLETNQEFSEYYFNQAAFNNTRCGDRAAMAFNELYCQWRLFTLDKNASLKEKLTLLKGFSRTIVLRTTIESMIRDYEKSNNCEVAESVEIFLYYESNLANELGLLTAIKSMTYVQIGKRDWIDIEKLKSAIEETYLDVLIVMSIVPDLIAADKNFSEFLAKEDTRLTVEKEKLVNQQVDELITNGEFCAKAKVMEDYRKNLIKKWVLVTLGEG